MKEQVLVFPASVLEGYYPEFARMEGAITSAMSVWFLSRRVMGSELHFMDREQAENDPSFKQVIPYCVLKSGNKIFAYQRSKKGGESRLHDLWSIGVGGHVNLGDASTAQGKGWRETYLWALGRELREEVNLDFTELASAPLVAMLYDNSNDVGKVHFGMVHLVDVGDRSAMKACREAIASSEWMTRDEVEQLNLENWSRLVVDRVL